MDETQVPNRHGADGGARASGLDAAAKRLYSLQTLDRQRARDRVPMTHRVRGQGMPNLRIDRGEILRHVIIQVEVKLSEMRAGYGAARDAVLSSPHVMKGKREVFGQEAAYLANALALNIQEREYDLKVLRNLRLPESPERVAMGCVVGVGPDAGPVEPLYFLLPVCGGMEVPMHEGEVSVRVITSGTPIAKALLGKVVGDEVTLPTPPPRVVVVKLLA